MNTLELVTKDVRQAARRLAAAPGFCLVVLATLGVGIGANRRPAVGVT